MDGGRQAWITGVGLVSSLGDGAAAHHRRLIEERNFAPVIEAAAFAPYPVHPLVPLDFSRQIPKKSDLNQMGPWQRIGVHAAGLALADAGIAGNGELLDRTNIIVAAGNGERDCDLDGRLMAGPAVSLNNQLMTGLRPTLYLGELSNLLAGNIQLILHATGSSRTLKGEEIAGASAVEDAVRRIRGDQGDLFVVGGALNAERDDLLLNYELDANLWRHPHRGVWQRGVDGGGMVLGSMAAFLVIEARAHAEARGATPYARVADVVTDRSRRGQGQAESVARGLFARLDVHQTTGSLPVLSGASGCEPATSDERAFLAGLAQGGGDPAIRAYGSVIGHGVEAHLPAGIALAALALRAGHFYAPFDAAGDERAFEGPPSRILVTSFGHWRGEGLALVERVAA